MDVDTSKKYNDIEKLLLAYDTAADRRSRDYKKGAPCLSCKYLYICDGVEHQVKDFVFSPVSGEKIRQVNHYREKFYE